MRKLIALLLFISFCGGATEETVDQVETTTTTSSTTSTSSSTSTTVSTSTLPDIMPTVLITCDPVVSDEDGLMTFNFEVTTGTNELVVLNIVSWFDSSRTDDLFISDGLPSSGNSNKFGYTVDASFSQYEIEMVVMDSKDNFANDYCLYEQNPKSSTQTTSPKSLYPDEPSSDTWIIYTGNGNQVVDVSSVDKTLKIMTVNASGGASIVSYNGNEYLDLLINKNGTEVDNETVLFNFEFEQPTLLEITATADWEIILKPVASARNFSDDEIKGSGSEVIEFYENNSTFQVLTFVSPTGVSVISYECDGSYNDLVINQLGSATDNSVRSASSTCYLEIVANGEWSISR